MPFYQLKNKNMQNTLDKTIEQQLQDIKQSLEISKTQLEITKIELEIEKEKFATQGADAYEKLKQEIDNVIKNKKYNTNNSLRKYADLSNVLDNIQEVLKDLDLGLAIYESQDEALHQQNEARYIIQTKLKCELKYKTAVINSVNALIFFENPDNQVKAQLQAGVITYKRRYLIKTLLGIAEKEDDADGARPNSKLSINMPTKNEILQQIENAENSQSLLTIAISNNLSQEDKKEIEGRKNLKKAELIQKKARSMINLEELNIFANQLAKEPPMQKIVLDRISEIKCQSI